MRWPYLLAGQASSGRKVGDVLRGDAPQDRHQVGESGVSAVCQQLCSTEDGKTQQHTGSVLLTGGENVSSRRLERSQTLAAVIAADFSQIFVFSKECWFYRGVARRGSVWRHVGVGIAGSWSSWRRIYRCLRRESALCDITKCTDTSFGAASSHTLTGSGSALWHSSVFCLPYQKGRRFWKVFISSRQQTEIKMQSSGVSGEFMLLASNNVREKIGGVELTLHTVLQVFVQLLLLFNSLLRNFGRSGETDQHHTHVVPASLQEDVRGKDSTSHITTNSNWRSSRWNTNNKTSYFTSNKNCVILTVIHPTTVKTATKIKITFVCSVQIYRCPFQLT